MPKALKTLTIILLSTVVCAGMAASTAWASQRFLTIGTGGVTGVYYPAGQRICQLVNRDREQHGLRCNAESTGGSVFNLNAIRAGEMDLGVVQSDWQYHAFRGSDLFADTGPDESLRAVMSLHPEPFTVLVRGDSDIRHFEDIRGKRVNVGNPGSGQRGTVEVLMRAYGWTMEDFTLVSELTSREQGQALCDNRIDVVLFTVGHPSAAIQEPIATCGARLIPVSGEVVDQLVAERPYYFTATIPAGMYPGQSEDVQTFGVGATLVSSTRTSADAINALVSAVFDNLETFRNLHPAFTVLTREDMVRQGLSAPLHEGARSYFEQAGLLD